MIAAAHLHVLPVAPSAAEAEAQGLGWLTDGERQRLQTITAAARRCSFLAGHWQARRLAAQWLQVDVRRIALQAHADGRPLLRVDGDAAPLHVSMSHSSGWLAVAVADAPVGVDIELPRRDRDWEALARFVFSPAELHCLRDGDAAARIRLFHAFWALKEARGKRSGEGLRPKAARTVTATACVPGRAEAMSWVFGDGALALALAPGMAVSLDGPALGEPAHWRYAEAERPAATD